MAENTENLFDHRLQNRELENALKTSINKIFPIENGGKKIVLNNITIDDALDDNDFPAQKEAKVNRKSWQMPIYADFEIQNDKGKVISKQSKLKIGNLPKITNRFTTIIDGNEYQTVNQLRRKSGIYSRVKRNGELEAEFNLSKGKNFKMQLDPVSQLFVISYANRKYRLWTLLTTLGLTDSDIEKVWGSKLLEINKKGALNTEASELRSIYEIVYGHVPKNSDDLVKGLRDYFNNKTEIDPSVTKMTLGAEFNRASGEALLATSKKLLDINRGKDQPDDRDSLLYKRIYSVEDLVNSYFEKQSPVIQGKLKRSLGLKDKVREIVSPATFGEPIKRFFTVGDLSSTPAQTNPVEIVNVWRKTTPMGTGGIKSHHAITMETRDVQPTHLGFLDPLNTPESGKVGVTVGLTSEVRKRGNDMVTPVVDKNNKMHWLDPIQFYNSKIGFPDQYDKIDGKIKPNVDKIKGIHKGQNLLLNPKEVDYYLRSPRTMFSFPSNLVPFLPNTQANRAGTGARMIGQAMGLDDREPPLVRTYRDRNTTYEDLLGGYLNPKLEEGETGTVEKVEGDYIDIKLSNGKPRRLGIYNNFPLNQDGFLNSTVLVNPGDKVDSTTALTESNYSKGHTLSIGKNLTVAYMPYKGYNFEDGAVITEEAAKKLSHTMLHKENIFFNPKMSKFDKEKFMAWYPEIISPDNSKKLDSRGIIKVGQTIDPGEVLAAFLVEKELDEQEAALKKLNKFIFNMYSKNVTTWDEEEPGIVTDVSIAGRNIDIYIKSTHPFKEGDKLCVDEETEFLTDSGWKPLLELSLKDSICTLNPKTHNIEYEIPSAINIYDHNDQMYHISSTNLDQCVTLDHKMYVKDRYSDKYQLLPTKDIIGKRVRYLKNGKWSGQTNIVPQQFKDQMDDTDYCELMGWYLAEGNTNKTSNSYITTIHQSKEKNPEKYAEVVEIVKSCGFHPILQKDRVVFNSKSFYEYATQFGHAHEKFVPKEIKNAVSDLIIVFLTSYAKGDGSINNSGQICITTNSIKMRDDLQELWLKAGFSANYSKVASVGEYIMGNPVNYDIWNIRQIQTKNSPQVNHGHVHSQQAQVEELISYTGKVGCPTTNNGIVYIRRNNKSSWTGNSGRYGNKYIVTKIIPTSDAPHRPSGDAVDIMLSPHSVPSRMNIGQILETAAGKIAEKTGKPYIVNNFEKPDQDMANKVYKEMQDLGIEANEQLTDGKTGQKIKNPIFVGKQYIMKLRHIVNKKQGVHNYGVYDVDEQPAGKGAQKVGTMDTYAYLAHGAKSNLYEIANIKGRRNEEYWRDLQFGLPPAKPSKNFIFEKMTTYLKGSGINVNKKGNKLQILPLTDDDITNMSNGEIKDPGAMLVGKNLTSRKDGLFDGDITGGVRGTQWGHINLVDRIPNPMFEDAIMKALDLTENSYESILNGKRDLNGKTGHQAIIDALKEINVSKRIKDLRAELKDAPPTNVNKLNTKIRYMQALQDLKMDPIKAYTISKIPIIPPVFRPVYPLPSGDLVVSDINKHYHDVGLINNKLKENLKDQFLPDKDRIEGMKTLYNSVKAMQGFIDPITYSKEKYKGFIQELGKMKTGLIHGKAWAHRQDVSGRSTITVEPNLGLNEVGIPREFAYTAYKPFILRNLKESGIKATQALKHYEEKSPTAMQALENVLKDRPVILNRAPSLHKHSVQAFRPVLTTGKSIRLNPLVVKGFNADFDGDTMSVMVPIGKEAVEEARQMVPSQILFKHGDNSLMPSISQDYLYGLHELSKITQGKTKRKFSTINEAKKSGIPWTELFSLNGKDMTIGQYMINADLPTALKDYTREMNKKTVNNVLTELGKKYPTFVEEVFNSWKDLGAAYSYINGNTISITDFAINRDYRDKILKQELPRIDKLRGDERVKAMNALTQRVQAEQDKELKAKNNIYKMLAAGSFSKPDSVRQILSMPGVMTDIENKPLPIPVTNSYGEGLDTSAYYNTLYSARKGTVDRSVNTQQTGALTKDILNVARRFLVVETDCGTKEGLEFDIDDKNLIDRTLLFTIPGVGKRNDLVDTETIIRAKNKGLKTLAVRSPLTCESVEGVCQLCYGLLPNGQFPPVGTNVGILDSEALTERATQLTMQTFHTGGSALGGGGIQEGFPRLEQLVKVPERLAGKATLSDTDGVIKSIIKNQTGGYNVIVNNKSHVVPSGRRPIVEVGQSVQAGDPLSDGVIKPQELGKLKSHLDAQKYIVDQASNIYGGDFNKKTFETVVKSISDNAEITNAPDDSGFIRGDTTTISYLNYLNRIRKREGLEPIEYRPFFKSVQTSNTDADDWMTKVTTNRVKAALTTGAGRGMYANLKGKDPIPAYLYGEEFGKNLNYEKGEFY